MESPSFLTPLFLIVLFSVSAAALPQSTDNFLQCLSLYSNDANSISKLIYTQSQNSTSYTSVLDASIRNARFSIPNTPKPLVIVTPSNVFHIQATIKCSRKHGLQIRIRSGGHDYEGYSYVSEVPFVIIDMINLRSIDVDVENKTARIQAGATIGELYYTIAQISTTLAFPAGVCPTVGIGGHFSGGGYGMLTRKHGLAADHIIDAQLVDVNGRILDRNSMGEDLFWAIRGGGGGNYGVVVAWKVNLVSVPSSVTVFNVSRTLEQNATKLVNKWQYLADKIDEDLYLRIFFEVVNSSQDGKRTILVSFTTLFLGGIDQLIPLVQEKFPVLGLVKDDCIEMSYFQSTLYFAGIPQNQPNLLLTRTFPHAFFVGKSDFVTEPIPENALEGLWKWVYEAKDIELVDLIFSPHGGIMENIPESEIPYPHRAGNIFQIHYAVAWGEADASTAERHINYLRRLYNYMEPYVSKNPRTAYVNYRDADLGTNNEGKYTSYTQASKWGLPYFKNNFHRLVFVKSIVDPQNFFRYEQSIPSIVP